MELSGREISNINTTFAGEGVRLRDIMDTPIADSYWVIPGRLLAGEYPGAFVEDGARRKLQSILDSGVNAFIDLTEEGELKPYSNLLPTRTALGDTSIAYHRMPIKDLGVPTASTMSIILESINGHLNNEAVVYVHCFGGIGRTGTVMGCYMVQEMAMTGTEALLRIEELRKDISDGSRMSPETQEQREMVMEWRDAAGLGEGPEA